jgi:hypothetical protein
MSKRVQPTTHYYRNSRPLCDQHGVERGPFVGSLNWSLVNCCACLALRAATEQPAEGAGAGEPDADSVVTVIYVLDRIDLFGEPPADLVTEGDKGLWRRGWRDAIEAVRRIDDE